MYVLKPHYTQSAGSKKSCVSSPAIADYAQINHIVAWQLPRFVIHENCIYDLNFIEIAFHISLRLSKAVDVWCTVFFISILNNTSLILNETYFFVTSQIQGKSCVVNAKMHQAGDLWLKIRYFSFFKKFQQNFLFYDRSIKNTSLIFIF